MYVMPLCVCERERERERERESERVIKQKQLCVTDAIDLDVHLTVYVWLE